MCVNHFKGPNTGTSPCSNQLKTPNQPMHHLRHNKWFKWWRMGNSCPPQWAFLLESFVVYIHPPSSQLWSYMSDNCQWPCWWCQKWRLKGLERVLKWGWRWIRIGSLFFFWEIETDLGGGFKFFFECSPVQFRRWSPVNLIFLKA